MSRCVANALLTRRWGDTNNQGCTSKAGFISGGTLKAGFILGCTSKAGLISGGTLKAGLNTAEVRLYVIFVSDICYLITTMGTLAPHSNRP